MIKFLPYPLVYVKEIENWLNQMSLDGYHLVKLNRNYATFTQDCSEDIKYSIITYDENNEDLNSDLDEESNSSQFIKDEWQLLQSKIYYNGVGLSNTHAHCSIYKSIVGKPPYNVQTEPIPPIALIEPTKRLSYNKFNLSILFLTAVTQLSLLAFRMIYFTYNLDHFYLWLLRIMVLMIPCIFFLIKGIKLNRLKKYYKGKKPYPKKPSKTHLLLTIIMLVLCFLVVFYAEPQKLGSPQDNTYLGDIDNLITLEVVEGEHSNLLQDEFLDDYYYGYSNFAPFMPLHYDLKEKTTTNEKDHTDLLLHVEYTKAYLTFPLNIASKYWGKYFRGSDDSKLQYTSTDHFYEIKYYKKSDGYFGIDAPSYSFLFRTKNELINIDYAGNRTPEEIIENINKLY